MKKLKEIRTRCSLDPLRAYNGEDITIQLPGELDVFGINWLSVYDVEGKANFGSVIIPEGLNVPPSLVKVMKSKASSYLFSKKWTGQFYSFIISEYSYLNIIID